MKTSVQAFRGLRWVCLSILSLAGLFLSQSLPAQTLLNIDFGAGSLSPKTGWAAAGQATNDYWNLYRHYEPRFAPGMPLVTDGILKDLKFADGSASSVSVTVSNAPGVWGNASGDPMFDSYLFSMNGSNFTVTLNSLPPGRYHFYLYGHADADVTGEQNSAFTLLSGTNRFGPLQTAGIGSWKLAQSAPSGYPASTPAGWREGYHYVVFRDVEVFPDKPVTLDVSAGPNGVPVLNGLQIVSRGTSPPQLVSTARLQPLDTATNLLFREVRYDGALSDDEARFGVAITVESKTTNQIIGPLFEGEVALRVAQMPDNLRLLTQPGGVWLVSSAPGIYNLDLQLVAKIQRAEPWNQIRFTGPAAAIASVTAQVAGQGVELQLLNGALLERAQKDDGSQIKGLVGADRIVALRWQSKTAEVRRKSFVAVETTAAIHLTPTVIKFQTQLAYNILQAGLQRLTVALPPGQTLTRLQGEQIRDWRVEPGGPAQILTIEFLKPIEKQYALTIFSEQASEGAGLSHSLLIPQPREIDREAGLLTLTAEDVTAEMENVTGLRQVNATAPALSAYRFNNRPFSLQARLRRIEPLVRTSDRVKARLEESRFLVDHALTLQVEKAGIYAVDLVPPPGFAVANVTGEGVDDWKAAEGKLRVNFASRLLGAKTLQIQLEQALKEFPTQVVVHPLRVAGATRETAEIGAAALSGLRLKTAELQGVREIPVHLLTRRVDELLAYQADQPDWRLTLATERLAPRVVADIFNLITIGDGLVGGSASLRFGIINQGVQELRVKLPAHWKNVEFTGPGIRRKESRTNEWTIGLQDKAWGGYTLVITYDFAFDPKGAELSMGGVHALGVERENGTVAITSAAGLRLKAKTVAEPLRRIDELELAPEDRALIMRPVMLAYRYTGEAYDLPLEVARFDQAQLLEAVADRTQLTTVLTDAGQMLTQASFMVKNNEKQFQRFRLPAGAEFWSSFVNNQPAKADKDGDWLLVPLPREENRDRAFAVDLVYAQKTGALNSWWSKPIALTAPGTDVPNTYAEWQLYVPHTRLLAGFGGSMSIARGTVYVWREAFEKCLEYYVQLERESAAELMVFGGIVFLLIVVFVGAKRRGRSGIMVGLVSFAVLMVLAAMLLPSLAKSKAKASRAAPMAGHESPLVQEPAQDLHEAVQTIREDKPSAQPPAEIPRDELAKREAEEKDRALAVVPGAPVPGQPPSQSQVMTPELLRRYGLAVDRTANMPAGTISGAGGLGGGAAGYPVQASIAKPTEAGIKPIYIEIPREGQAYLFTKVLNVSGEPLTIKARVKDASYAVSARSMTQALALLLGLLLMRRYWRQEPRRPFWIAVGLLLALGAVAHLLLTWRVLHVGLIALAPLLALWILGWLVWKMTPARSAVGAGAVPPVMALITLLAWPGSVDADLFPAAAGTVSTNAVTIFSAKYSGTVSEQAASLDAEFRLLSARTNQILRLFSQEVVVQKFSAQPPGAQLFRDGQNVCVELPAAGETILNLKCLVKVGGDSIRRQLAFPIPAALVSEMALAIQEPDAEVEFPCVALKRSNRGQQTVLDAVLGPGQPVDLRWTPRVKRAAEVAATLFCQNHASVKVGNGVVSTHAVLEYQITQGELRQARVRLPQGHRLVKVEGAGLRSWEQRDDSGSPVLVVDLLKGVSTAWTLLVETEKPLDTLPATVAVALPHALDVKRETGLVALTGTEELSLTVESKDLQRVDAEEFARVTGQKLDGVAGVFRFLKPDFQLTARAELIQPEIEVVLRNAVVIGVEQTILNAQLDYQIKKAGVFTLPLALPGGFRVDKVAGDKILQWTERTNQTARLLEVVFNERVAGAYTLRLSLILAHSDLPKQVDVAGVQPLQSAKLTSYVSVSAELGVALKTESFEGLSEIPATSLPVMNPLAAENSAAPQSRSAAETNPATGQPLAGGGLLAFKGLAADNAAPGAWKLRVGAEAVEAWLRAEIVNTFTITDALLSGRALVRYEIANAPAKEFVLRIPPAFTNIDITGPDIRRRDQNGDQWRVQLQNKVRGSCLLVVTWEQPKPARTNLMSLVGVSAMGVERETGFITVVARPPWQVQIRAAGDLLKADVRDLPDWAGQTEAATAVAYRYLRPGGALGLEIRRLDEAEVLQALVDNGQLTTVVADDGQTITEMTLMVRNNGRQHLELELPTGAEPWAAFVAGQPVRPSLRDGRVLLPLERSGADGGAFSVELIFVHTNRFPRWRGGVDLVSPKMDVPLKNIRWDLYLPPGYRFSDFGGTMSQEIIAAAAPRSGSFISSRYSLDDYQQQEGRKVAMLNSEVQSNVRRAQTKLAEGNIKEAVESYRQIRVGKGRYGALYQDVKRLEQDLNGIQGSNLLLRQNAINFENNGQNFFDLSLGRPTSQVGVPGAAIGQAEGRVAGAFGAGIGLFNNDAAAAEQQWIKLQQAQEVATSKAQPLRVNLPLRGTHLAFRQVLQTETSRPLSIHFYANNLQSGSGWKSGLVLLVVFGVLWRMAAAVGRRKGAGK